MTPIVTTMSAPSGRGRRVAYSGGTGGGGGNNEPSGFTQVFDNPMSAAPTLGSDDSFGFQRFELNGNRLSIGTDGTAPTSPSNYLRVTFPTGVALNSDYATPFRAGSNFSGSGLSSPKSELYVRVAFRISSDWTDNGNTGSKFFFFSQAEDSAGIRNNHYINLTNAAGGDTELSPEIRLQRNGWTFSGVGSVNYPASRLTGITKGAWHILEFYAKANTVVAGVSEAADGIGKIWVDGSLLLNQTDIAYFHRSMTPCWRSLYCNPTYGGGSNTPPRDLYLDIDNWYTSTKA